MRRNRVILAAWRAGLSRALLADVFDLSASRIKAITLAAGAAKTGRTGESIPCGGRDL